MAVSETEHPVLGDIWFWSDDNAKVLDLLGTETVWRNNREVVPQILSFLTDMSEDALILRRIAAPRLEKLARSDGVAAYTHGLLDIGARPERAEVSLGMRFHDGRTARNAVLGRHYVSFSFGGIRHSVPVGKAIVSSRIEETPDHVVFVSVAEIVVDRVPGIGPKKRIGTVTYSTTVRINTVIAEIEAEFQIDPGVSVSDVVLAFVFDELSPSKNDVRYESIKLVRAGCSEPEAESGNLRKGLDAAGADYWAVVQDSHLSGFALAVHCLPKAGSPIHRLVGTRNTTGTLRTVASEHRFSGRHAGARLVAGEHKIITSGGFYNRPEIYARMFAEAITRVPGLQAPIDYSVSYDYGAEVKAYSRCFASLTKDCTLSSDPAMKAFLQDRVDYYHHAYNALFIEPAQSRQAALFSRSVSFMAFAYTDMIKATGETKYRDALRACCDIIMTFERRNSGVAGRPQSGFLMGQENDALPYPDCHGSCLLTLIYGTVYLREHKWLESIHLGFSAYRLDTMYIEYFGGSIQDLVGVDFELQNGRQRTMDTFWNFNGALTLRAIVALRTAPDPALRRIWVHQAQRLTLFERAIRHRLASSQRVRGETTEIVSSTLSAETNSETQPWAALALTGNGDW
ncbi:MAG: hypothetical protein JJ902_08325 [Roseibium sp.]|nr:hypothetical protein [Roseibium sp.]